MFTLFPWLVIPLPKIVSPPQSPLTLEPAALLDVNTIGLQGVPFAMIVAPLCTTKELITVSASPRITVPASMVSVTKLSTYTTPCNKYTLFFVHVVFAVIIPVTFTVGAG